MFIAQAHSFAQQARLAITLAWVAGYANIMGVLTCKHVISHVSGTTSDLGRFAAAADWSAALFMLFLLAAFMAGAVMSALATELGRRRGWESIYVLPMVIETLLLTGFAVGVNVHDLAVSETGLPLYLMTGMASAAMGLQNATITRISSGVVRTTHVTGVLTDLGTELAHLALFLSDQRRSWTGAGAFAAALRKHQSVRRLALLVSIMGSFALGAGLATLAYLHFPRLSMYPPVVFLLWVIAQDLRAPIAEIEPAEIAREAELALPAELGVYHLRKDGARRGGAVQRLPDLMAWLDRLPDGIRVVVLDLDQVTQMDPDSALELRAAVRRMAAQGKHLILAGITPAQFRELSDAGEEALNPMSACPDVELALARGVMLLHGGGRGRERDGGSLAS